MGRARPAQPPKSHSPNAEAAIEHAGHAEQPKLAIAHTVWALEQVTGRGEREVARIAASQRGFAVREQLTAAGIGRGAISHRLRTGRLRERYRGVYLVDRASIEPLGEETAAVLLYRGHAVLSHRSAAAIWGILDAWPTGVTLTLVGEHRRPPPGIRLHCVGGLDRVDLRLRAGLPVIAPARTVQDLASDSSDAELEQAVAVAQSRRIARGEEIRAAIRRAPGRRGSARLARLLETGDASGYTRSQAEHRLRGLLRAAELPQPRANVPLLGYVADFVWADARLVVEVDGYGFHSSRPSFERDRRRDQRFAAAGYLVLRITWRQLLEEPYAVIARLAQALAARAA